MTQCRVYILIIFAWILSLIVSLARLIGFKSPEQASVHRICEMSDNFSYALGSAALSYYIPLVVILFVYYKIFRLARAHLKFIKKSKGRLNTTDKNNNNVNYSGANIKLIEYNKNKNNDDNHLNNKNSNINIADKEVNFETDYCKCKINVNESNTTDSNVDTKLINQKFNRLKGNQIKKIDKTTMQLSNNSNHHLSSSSSFSSSKSFSIASSNNQNASKREVCENCKKYTNMSLSSKIINLKYQNGSTTNYFVVTSSTISTAKPKIKSGIPKKIRILNFLRKITKLKTEQKAAKTLGIVVG
jgi:hypothetical protein